jgi:hypothetical protein
MPDCHKCPHFSKVQNGYYNNKPWSKTPCGRCPGPSENPSHHGVSMISMEAGSSNTDQTLAEVEASIMTELQYEPEKDRQVSLINQAADVRIARGLLSLTDRQRQIALAVFDCLTDGHIMSDYRTQADVARKIGHTSPQAINAALGEICRRWPEFEAVTSRIFDVTKDRMIRGAGKRGRP